MATNEYTKALDKALADLSSQVQSRDLLNASIAGLRETVRVLSNRVEMSPERQRQVAQLLAMADSATPKVTDAIRALLISAYPKEMTAIDVRNALEDSSNFDDFSNSLSACHAALKRMLSDGEVEPGSPKDGKASYRYVLKLETSYANTLGALSALSGISGAVIGLMSQFHPENVPADDPAHKLGDGARFPKAPRPPNWKGGLPAPLKK
jgi:hypothetical protein